MVENTFDVPKNQWKRMGDQERELFNRLYSFGEENQHIMTHPQHQRIFDEFWKTISWNFSWMAVDYLIDIKKEQNA